MIAKKVIMGMLIHLEIVDKDLSLEIFKTISQKVFVFLESVDEKFSTYKSTSEISKINNLGNFDFMKDKNILSKEMLEIFELSEKTKQETNGYFNILNNKTIKKFYDPSGLVKGWSIYEAVKILKANNCQNFLIDIGSDIQVNGKNKDGEAWKVGIKNPFNTSQIIKILHLEKCEGVATSAKYAKGEHIYNPYNTQDKLEEIVSVTIVGKNVYEADRFATAVFSMGKEGITFLEHRNILQENLTNKLEGCIIDKNGIVTMTSNFKQYVK